MRRFYRVDEAARLWAVSKRTVYRFLRRGAVAGVRRGDVWWLTRETVMDMRGGRDEHDRLLRPREAAWKLGLSRSSVYRWFWEGKLRGVKLAGGPVRIYESSVRAQLEGGGV